MPEGRIPALPTGFASLDAACGIGGLPRGHIVEIFGPPNSGKTALALQAIAHLQRQRGAAAWIDAEHVFDPAFAMQLGLDLDRIAVAQPDSAEQAFHMIHRFTESGAVDLIVIDSAAALTPEFELDAGLAADTTALQSRVLGSELRKLVPAAARSGVCVVFLNQTRARLDSAPGELETSAGGPSLKLHSAVRIALAAAGKIVRFRVLKNKFGPPFQKGELQWLPGSGFVECP